MDKPKREMTEVQKANLRKGQEALKAKREAIKRGEVTSEKKEEVKTSTRSLSIVSVDGKEMDVSIGSQRWKGKEITIDALDAQQLGGITFDELVNEVTRILNEGGYKIAKKEDLL